MIIRHLRGRNGHASADLGLDQLERLPLRVLLRDHRDGQRPFESEPRVVVGEPAFGLGGVELAHLVARLRLVDEGLVAVREPLRHVQRAAVVLVQLDARCSEVCRALGPQVDDDVDDRAARAADDLRLGLRRILEMHAAQRARRRVEGDVRLGDHGLEPVIGELVLAERAREVAARVLPALQVDHEGARQRRLCEDHVSPLLRSGLCRDGREPPQLRVQPAVVEQCLQTRQAHEPVAGECRLVHAAAR